MHDSLNCLDFHTKKWMNFCFCYFDKNTCIAFCVLGYHPHYCTNFRSVLTNKIKFTVNMTHLRCSSKWFVLFGCCFVLIKQEQLEQLQVCTFRKMARNDDWFYSSNWDKFSGRKKHEFLCLDYCEPFLWLSCLSFFWSTEESERWQKYMLNDDGFWIFLGVYFLLFTFLLLSITKRMNEYFINRCWILSISARHFQEIVYHLKTIWMWIIKTSLHMKKVNI